MSFSIGGLASGIDTAGLVASLMQAERIPQQKLLRQQQESLKAVASWNDLRTRMQGLQTAADALATPAKALGSTATTSDDKTVKATATAGAAPGQYVVKVNQVATAEQRVKSDVGPLSMTVGAGRSVLQAGTRSPAVPPATSGAFRLDVDFAGAAAGVQSVEVTRGSAPAAVYGTPALSFPSDPAQRTLTVAVDGGSPVEVTLAESYADSQALADDLRSKLAGSGATATLVGGRLQLATQSEGSGRTLQLGGPAASTLALPTTAAKGQSALVTVNGKTQEVEPESAGSGAPRAQALGQSGIVLKVGSSISTGSLKANVVVTTETTTLADLQGLLNTTGSPVSAAVVAQDGKNTLVLSSTATGTDGSLDIASALATLSSVPVKTAAQNSKLDINGVAVERSTNKLDNILPGLSLDLLSKPADGLDRTVTVSRDSSGTVDKVKAMVDAMNGIVAKIATDTKYDVKSKTGGPLVGDGAARSLSATLFQKASGIVGTPDLRTLSQLGIQSTRDGKFEFKPDVLTKALAADPDTAAKVLAEFADSVATFAKTTAQTGGLLTGRREGAQAEADSRQKQADAMQVRLDAVEKRYKATYAAMETALARVKSQGGAISAALSSFSNSNR